MSKNSILSSVVCVATGLLLSACGGGGSSNSNSGSTTSNGAGSGSAQSGSYVNIATSVATPTYGATDPRATIFNLLNAYRQLAGVGLLAQDPILDTSAANHANYLVSNNSSGHTETAGLTGYTGSDPYRQAIAAGANPNQIVGQVIAYEKPSITATECLQLLTNSVYHLSDLLGGQQTVGSALNQWTCVINFASQAGTTASNAGFYSTEFTGQQPPDSTLIVSPLQDETVQGQGLTYGETPNPVPDLTAPVGHPVMFSIPRGVILNVSSFTLTNSVGVAIPSRILIPSTSKNGSTSSAVVDANNGLPRNAVFLIPLAPLNGGSYTATFQGSRGDTGAIINKTWSFNVGGNWALPGGVTKPN